MSQLAPSAMADLVLLTAVIGLAALAYWLSTGSDDDNGGGGLMQPVLIPVRSRGTGRAH